MDTEKLHILTTTCGTPGYMVLQRYWLFVLPREHWQRTDVLTNLLLFDILMVGTRNLSKVWTWKTRGYVGFGRDHLLFTVWLYAL